MLKGARESLTTRRNGDQRPRAARDGDKTNGVVPQSDASGVRDNAQSAKRRHRARQAGDGSIWQAVEDEFSRSKTGTSSSLRTDRWDPAVS